jgi:hypothetical protein
MDWVSGDTALESGGGMENDCRGVYTDFEKKKAEIFFLCRRLAGEECALYL